MHAPGVYSVRTIVLYQFPPSLPVYIYIDLKQQQKQKHRIDEELRSCFLCPSAFCELFHRYFPSYFLLSRVFFSFPPPVPKKQRVVRRPGETGAELEPGFVSRPAGWIFSEGGRSGDIEGRAGRHDYDDEKTSWEERERERKKTPSTELAFRVFCPARPSPFLMDRGSLFSWEREPLLARLAEKCGCCCCCSSKLPLLLLLLAACVCNFSSRATAAADIVLVLFLQFLLLLLLLLLVLLVFW